jgi:RimJ/RimL family protein N-acetyltransferase
MKEQDFSQLRINSPRLILVPSTQDFSSVTFKEYTEEIARFMYHKPYESEEAAKKALSEGFEKMKSGSIISLTLLDKETEEFIGRASLLDANTETPEIGIWIKKSAHRKGYGRESIGALIVWANTNLKFKYLRYPVDKRNPRSIEIAKFFEGIIGREYKKKNWSGELDDIEYWIYKK